MWIWIPFVIVSATLAPVHSPTNFYGAPTVSPSVLLEPTAAPTQGPSLNTFGPTPEPGSSFTAPSSGPSLAPADSPAPSASPHQSSTSQPTGSPSAEPTGSPTGVPSAEPTGSPSIQPSGVPSTEPTGSPSIQPSGVPSTEPTGSPSGVPSAQPTGMPSGEPSVQPTGMPTGVPSAQPTGEPTGVPSAEPTGSPSGVPTGNPSLPIAATERPSMQPSYHPSATPSIQPSRSPSVSSDSPSVQPSATPSVSSDSPSVQPSATPSVSSDSPSVQPSSPETITPSTHPTLYPTSRLFLGIQLDYSRSVRDANARCIERSGTTCWRQSLDFTENVVYTAANSYGWGNFWIHLSFFTCAPNGTPRNTVVVNTRSLAEFQARMQDLRKRPTRRMYGTCPSEGASVVLSQMRRIPAWPAKYLIVSDGIIQESDQNAYMRLASQLRSRSDACGVTIGRASVNFLKRALGCVVPIESYTDFSQANVVLKWVKDGT